ncbi:MAG: alpha/beta fold hydrolase [Gammaproteobacteria bacterium]
MTETPVVILLRGMLREQRHWGEFRSSLEDRLPDRALLALDLPGNGVLYDERSPCSIAAMTEALRKRVGSDAVRANIIAISMGAMVALDWMTRYPDEIASAVLINTSVRPFSPFYRRLRPHNYARLPLLFKAVPTREKLILSVTSNKHADDNALLVKWTAWQHQYPVSPLNMVRQLFAAATFKVECRPRQPLLLVGSRHDRLVDYRCSAALASAWDAPYLEHPGAGHDLPLDEPEWLAERISKWLEESQVNSGWCNGREKL